jgi:N4-gp56 family major capsid protein
MATFTAGVNHPLAVKLWSRKLFREALKETFMSTFIGEDSSNGVQFLTDTKKDKGDTVHVGLRMQLSGTGVQGHNTLEGNEEDLTLYRDSVLLDELVHAARSNVRITAQRVPFSVREEMRMGMQDWWSDRIDTSIINAMAGNTAQTDTRYSGNNSTTAPTIFVGANGTTTEGSLSDTLSDQFSLTQIDRAVTIAKTGNNGAQPPIRPFRINGGSYYCAVLHPHQVLSLRTNTATGTWNDVQRALLSGGVNKDNRLFTGALGMWNNTLLYENTRIPDVVTAGGGALADVTLGKRAIFFGAQAASISVGMNNMPEKMTWVEEYFDYQRQLGVSAGMIFGVKKMVFNSLDFGVIAMPSYAPGP